MAKREYTKGPLTVLWDSDLCIHCEACYQALPSVFDPKARPWVNLDGAPPIMIEDQVRKCPSGALSIKSETGG